MVHSMAPVSAKVTLHWQQPACKLAFRVTSRNPQGLRVSMLIAAAQLRLTAAQLLLTWWSYRSSLSMKSIASADTRCWLSAFTNLVHGLRECLQTHTGHAGSGSVLSRWRSLLLALGTRTLHLDLPACMGACALPTQGQRPRQGDAAAV